jgi:hypothetical protein
MTKARYAASDPALNLDFGKGYSASLSGQVRFGEGLLGRCVDDNHMAGLADDVCF